MNKVVYRIIYQRPLFIKLITYLWAAQYQAHQKAPGASRAALSPKKIQKRSIIRILHVNFSNRKRTYKQNLIKIMKIGYCGIQ